MQRTDERERVAAGSALPAGLAGIGAVFLTSAVLTAITNELWFLRIVVTDGPPPRVDERVGPGRLRGQLWILPGFLVGVLAARMSRVRIPLSSGLAALSVFAIGIVVANYLTWVARYTVCFSSDFTARCIDPEYLSWFAAHIALGAITSMVLIRVGGARRDALILGAVLALAYLPAPVHQIALISGEGIPALLGNLGALAGVLTFVLLSLRGRSDPGDRWWSVRVWRDGAPPTEPSASGAPCVTPPDALSAGAASSGPVAGEAW